MQKKVINDEAKYLLKQVYEIDECIVGLSRNIYTDNCDKDCKLSAYKKIEELTAIRNSIHRQAMEVFPKN